MKNRIGLAAIRNLDYTVLLCDDVDVMAEFYGHVLGFEQRSAVPGAWAEFHAGGSLLALRARSRPYDGASQPGADVHLAFRVGLSDIDVCVDQLAELKIELIEPVSEFAEFGHRALFFADPEGNVIEVYADI